MSPNPIASPFDRSAGSKSPCGRRKAGNGSFDPSSYEERRRALRSPWVTRLRPRPSNLPPTDMRRGGGGGGESGKAESSRGGQFQSPAAKRDLDQGKKLFFLQRKVFNGLGGGMLSLFFQAPHASDYACLRDNYSSQHKYKEILENQIRVRFASSKCLSSPVFYSRLQGIINGSSSRNAGATFSSLRHVARSRDAIFGGADGASARRNLSDHHVLENNMAPHQLKRETPVCMNEKEKHISFWNMKRYMGADTVASDNTTVGLTIKVGQRRITDREEFLPSKSKKVVSDLK